MSAVGGYIPYPPDLSPRVKGVLQGSAGRWGIGDRSQGETNTRGESCFAESCLFDCYFIPPIPHIPLSPTIYRIRLKQVKGWGIRLGDKSSFRGIPSGSMGKPIDATKAKEIIDPVQG